MFEQFLRKTHNNGTHIHDRIDTSNELTNFVEELEDIWRLACVGDVHLPRFDSRLIKLNKTIVEDRNLERQ